MKSAVIPILEAKTVGVTPMRILVLEQFIEKNNAKNLHDLEAALPYSDRTTIYRTLKTFVEKGILHTIEDGSGAIRYALCAANCDAHSHQDFHPHFRCTICEQTVCLASVALPALLVPEGYQQQEVEMMVKGICPNCQ